MRLWIIYKNDDIKRNERFINYLKEACKKQNIEASLITYEELDLNDSFTPLYKNKEITTLPNAIMNRTNEYKLSKYFESLNIRVFNNSTLTKIANDKSLCYKYVENEFIKIQKTHQISSTFQDCDFPKIIKNSKGRGGNEVYKANNNYELQEILKSCPNPLIQDYLKTKEAKDLRVYVINNKIITCILRKSSSDFRANYSISHNAEVYTPNNHQLQTINKVINLFEIDYAGIDFLMDDYGELYFNEIEDSVGARAVYELTNINIAEVYIKHIKKQVT